MTTFVSHLQAQIDRLREERDGWMQQAAETAIAVAGHGKFPVSLADALEATVEAPTESTTEIARLKARVAER